MSAKKKPAKKQFTPVLVGYRTRSGVRLFAVKHGAAPWKTDVGKKPEERDDLDWLGHIPGAGVKDWRNEIQRIESHDILPPLEPDIKRMKAGPRVRARAQEWAQAQSESVLDAARAKGKESEIDKAWENERECENAHHKERTEAQSLAVDYVLALLRIEKMLRVVATSPDTEELTRRDIVRNLRPFYERIWTARETKTAGKNAGDDRKLYLDFMKLPEWEEAGKKVGKRRGKKTKVAHPEIARWTVAEMVRVHEDAGRHRRLKYETDEDGEAIKREGLPGPDMEKFRSFPAFWTGYLRAHLIARWEEHRNKIAKEEGRERDLAEQERRRQAVAPAAQQGVPFKDHGPVPLTKLEKPFERDFKDREGAILSAAEEYYLKEMQQFHYDPKHEAEMEKLAEELLEMWKAPPPPKSPSRKVRRKKAGAGDKA